MKSVVQKIYSPAQVAAQVKRMGREISRDYAGRTVDVVAVLEDSFIFAADLVRHISVPVVCHFVRTEMREVKLGGYDRREIFFSHEPRLGGRDVLLVDAVLHTGVTLEFLAHRLLQNDPRSLQIAVLIDKPQERKVGLHPAYFGFQAASKYLVGYGLAGSQGVHRNLPYIGTPNGAPRKSARPARKTARRRKRAKKAR